MFHPRVLISAPPNRNIPASEICAKKMKAFIAMSAIALVLAPPTITTTHAQLNTVPRRLRANKETNDWGRHDNAPQASKAHRQMTRDGHRIRTIAPVQEVAMSLSMPIEDSITSPVPALDQNTFDIDMDVELDPCLVSKVVHSKKQCRKAINRGEQCAWNTDDEIHHCVPTGTTRRLTRALEESESMSMSMQFDMLTTPERDRGWRRQLQTLDVDLSMSMQTDAITQAQFNEVDPCASLSSKRQCRKNRSQVAGSTCSWDNNSGTCQSTTFDSRRMTSNIGEDGVWGRDLEDLADGLSMSMPKDDILISDTSNNEATAAAIEPTEATVAATEVGPCASLTTVRQCRKNGSQVTGSTCSWDNNIGKCQSAAAIEATEATVAATETTETTVAAAETTTTTTATATTTAAADPCAELINRKKCRRMDGCTWDNEVCYTAPPATTTAAAVEEGDGNDFLAPPGFINTPNSSGNGNNSPTASPVIELTPFPTLGPRFVKAEEAEQEFIL